MYLNVSDSKLERKYCLKRVLEMYKQNSYNYFHNYHNFSLILMILTNNLIEITFTETYRRVIKLLPFKMSMFWVIRFE